MSEWREDDELAELYPYDWCPKHLEYYTQKCDKCEDDPAPAGQEKT